MYTIVKIQNLNLKKKYKYIELLKINFLALSALLVKSYHIIYTPNGGVYSKYSLDEGGDGGVYSLKKNPLIGIPSQNVSKIVLKS